MSNKGSSQYIVRDMCSRFASWLRLPLGHCHDTTERQQVGTEGGCWGHQAASII